MIWKKFHGSQKQQVIPRTTLAPWVWLKKTLTKTWKWKIRYNQLHWWLSKTGKSFHLKHQAGSWYVFWVWQACSSVFAIDVNRSHQILYKSILTLTATYRQCIERITCVMSHWKKEILQWSTCDKYLNLIFSVIFYDLRSYHGKLLWIHLKYHTPIWCYENYKLTPLSN